MQKKCIGVLFSLLLLVSWAWAIHGECVRAASHLDSHAEHDTSLIHCRDVFLIVNGVSATAKQFSGRDLRRALPSNCQTLDVIISFVWFKDHPFWRSLSQQDLFRLEEVYRL